MGSLTGSHPGGCQNFRCSDPLGCDLYRDLRNAAGVEFDENYLSAPAKKKAATSSPRHRLDSQSLEIVRRASALPKAPRALDEYIQHSSG